MTRRPAEPRRASPAQKPDVRKKGVVECLVIGLAQGFAPRVGQLLADGLWPWIVRAVGWAAGMIGAWLATETGCWGIC